MDFLAGGLELLAIWMVGDKNRWGFVVGCASCAIWISIAARIGLYGLIAVTGPCLILNIVNFKKWSRNGH